MMAANTQREVMRLMQRGDFAAALLAVDDLLRRQAQSAALLIARAQCLLALGRRDEALAAARDAEQLSPALGAIRDAAGSIYSLGHEQRRAEASYSAAIAAEPGNARFLYNRASVRRFLGDLEAAESDYDACIRLDPSDFEACKHRSDLRTQTPARNHIPELEERAAQGFADWRAEVHVRYALAKEHEDLGDYAKSFAELTRGASVRRRHMRYEVGTDLATVEWIIEAFPAAMPAPQQAAQDAPVFVLGLPRSGTTLVERILGSHSALISAGELDSFAMSLVNAARRSSGGAQLGRQQLVRQSAALDFSALGREYLLRAAAALPAPGRFIDKMPLNFLYCGLIRRALPNARLVHVTRHPMAVCYAMYKALFKDAYPFSYDLAEIAQYYLGYRRLMEHWTRTLGEQLYTVSYEALVADQAGESRKLLNFCGLEWQEACAQFHKNPAAATTASAAQVRRPIYDSSVAQWRHYEVQLAELRAQLEAAGIQI